MADQPTSVGSRKTTMLGVIFTAMIPLAATATEDNYNFGFGVLVAIVGGIALIGQIIQDRRKQAKNP